MPRIAYKPKTFAAGTQVVIDQANAILNQYAAEGYDLTLRQLYYQFVARDLIPNNMKSYKRLGSIVNDARLAGLVDWDSIVDRTRNVEEADWWVDPESIVVSAAKSFALDTWKTQPTYVEVWVEKDALVGVIERACEPLRVSYLSCRGYVSQSEMWRAAVRFGKRIRKGQDIVVLHLGDHDPSGIDMSRDIHDRIFDFLYGDGFDPEGHFRLDRIALNWDQVQQYSPPPNPAKVTDSRAASYISRFGRESWELDALEPSVLATLIDDHVLPLRDAVAWQAVVDREERERKVLLAISDQWADVSDFVLGGE